MILHGRTFSAVLYGHIEITALNAKGQIAIQCERGNSFVVDAQIIEAQTTHHVGVTAMAPWSFGAGSEL